MTGCHWIVCERTGRWTAALNVAITRDLAEAHRLNRAQQVRTPGELTSRLDEQPFAVVLLELRTTNLAELLEWLAIEVPARSHARFVALIDAADLDQEQRQAMAEAALAAGAMDLAFSPRHLQHVLLIGRRHAESHAAAPAHTLPGADWDLSCLLPWQEP
jgi:hypothetical protein